MQIQLSNENHVKDYVKSSIYAFLKISHRWNYINYLFDKWHDQHLKQKGHMSKFTPCAKNTNVSPIIFNQYDVNIYVQQTWQGIPYLGGIFIQFYKKTCVSHWFWSCLKSTSNVNNKYNIFVNFYIAFNIFMLKFGFS
jgi:hypothetical protein